VGEHTAAQQPRLAINSANYAVVGYRGFAGKGDASFSGEVGAAVADLNAADLSWSAPALLTRDADRQWQLDLAVESTSGAVHVLDVADGGGAGVQADGAGLRRLSTLTGDNVIAMRLPFGSDLAIAATDLSFSDSHPEPGDVVEITATVRNAGLRGVDAPVVVAFYRDDPSAAGNEIGRVTLPGPLLFNGAAAAALAWTTDGAPHEIYAVVDPEDGIRELIETNNQAHVVLGIPPAPTNLVAMSDPLGGAVYLAWQAPLTDGLAGYRILRAPAEGGPYEQTGWAPDTSYTDDGLANGQTYYYVVAAVDAFGKESVYSNEASATAGRSVLYAVYLPVVMSNR